MFDAIFHPTDLSPASTSAHLLAVRLASLSHGELLAAHVGAGEPDWSQWPDLEAVVKGWGTDAEPDAHAPHSQRLHIDAAAPLEALLEGIHSFRPDLLVLRTQGRAGLQHLFAGSVAEPLIRQSRVPALVIPPSAKAILDAESGTFSVGRVLFPIAPRPHPGPARETTIELLAHMGCSQAAVEELFVGEASDAPFFRGSSAGDPTWTQHTMRTGDIVASILHRARAIDADLIVMTSRGHDGALDALFGSTTENVLRHAPCPVLVVPARR